MIIADDTKNALSLRESLNQMKHLLSTIVVFSLCSGLFGQDSTSVYCEMIGTSDVFRKKMTVEIVYGKDKKDPVTFESMPEGLNYMTKKGWTFVHAYALSQGGDRAVAENKYYYILRYDKAKSDKTAR